ncbi:hypothetical protein NPIL_530911, partial [Nephila pilipes]
MDDESRNEQFIIRAAAWLLFFGNKEKVSEARVFSF